jgi:CHAT domain-containing protein/Tfp pilus assembly protein PilF
LKRAGNSKGYFLLLHFFCLLLSAEPAAVSAYNLPEWPPIAPTQETGTVSLQAQPIEREFKGGEKHSWRISLRPGQYLKIVVEQKGIDVVVRLLEPGGRQLIEMDSPNGKQGPEIVSAVVETMGEHLLEVSALDAKAAPGRYEVKVSELRESTTEDRHRIAAESALAVTLAEARQLRTQGTRESKQKAIEKLDEALPLLRTLEDRQGEARVLNDAGTLYWELSENKKALEYHNRAVQLRRALGNRAAEATSLYAVGLVYWQMGDSHKALEYYNQALRLKRAAGDRQGEAFTLTAIGTALEHLGRLQEALESHTRALDLERAQGNPRHVANALSNIGVVYRKLGDLQKALDHYNQALSLIRGAGDRRTEAVTLNNMGVLYWQSGDSQRALNYYNQALPLRRETGDRSGEFSTLHNIGAVFGSSGDSRKALEYYGQALSLIRVLKDRRAEASTLQNIGVIYRESGDPQKALEHYNQALALRREVGDRWGEAITLSQLGLIYSLLGRPEESLAHLHQALSLHRAVGDWGSEAGTLKNLARVERGRGRPAEARALIEAALNIVESTRAKFTSHELRISFSASRQDYYEFYIDLLMEMHRSRPSDGHDAAALQISERARARSFVEILTEARADIRQGVEVALLDRERSLQDQINAKAQRLTRLAGDKHTKEQATAAREEVEALLGEYQEVEAQIRTRSPRYAALTQPRPLSLSEIQRELDDETLLLEYALGEERSYLWAVTSGSIKSFVLPKRAEIETAARQVYHHIVAKSDALYPEAVTGLGRTLLSPVADQLGRKRLLIVADGALQYVPFGALPEPAQSHPRAVVDKGTATNRFSPLLLEHEIVSLPSASVLAALRQELPTRKAAPRKLIVLADPVFSKDDQRVKARLEGRNGSIAGDGKEWPGLSSQIERAANEAGLAAFDRLLLSRREAELITSLTPNGQSLKMLDFAASRATATSHVLSQYQIVHFATHSLLNDRHPELSGIVLSLVDEQGLPQDGFLRLHEIYNLKLEADLVVLSACQTALGKEIKGEGLVGLTRGFMYAGALRVVASMWEVSDSATAELMKRFYQNMLHRGLRPAAALRAAQISLSKERQWTAPFYWAGFVLQGEWR